MVLGVAGYGMVGKDTVGDVLVEEFEYRKFSFADPIRLLAEKINPIVDFELDESGVVSPVSYREAIAKYGYNEAKEKVFGVRKFLQNLGLEAREVLGQSVWVDRVMCGLLPDDKVVNVSVRFFDEEEAIRKFSGKIILVTRPDFGPLNDHATEKFAGQVVPDYTIVNDSTKENLAEKVRVLVKELEANW